MRRGPYLNRHINLCGISAPSRHHICHEAANAPQHAVTSQADVAFQAGQSCPGATSHSVDNPCTGRCHHRHFVCQNSRPSSQSGVHPPSWIQPPSWSLIPFLVAPCLTKLRPHQAQTASPSSDRLTRPARLTRFTSPNQTFSAAPDFLSLTRFLHPLRPTFPSWADESVQVAIPARVPSLIPALIPCRLLIPHRHTPASSPGTIVPDSGHPSPRPALSG